MLANPPHMPLDWSTWAQDVALRKMVACSVCKGKGGYLVDRQWLNCSACNKPPWDRKGSGQVRQFPLGLEQWLASLDCWQCKGSGLYSASQRGSDGPDRCSECDGSGRFRVWPSVVYAFSEDAGSTDWHTWTQRMWFEKTVVSPEHIIALNIDQAKLFIRHVIGGVVEEEWRQDLQKMVYGWRNDVASFGFDATADTAYDLLMAVQRAEVAE